MKPIRIFLLVLIAVSILAFQLAWTYSAMKAAPAFVAEVTLRSQTLPTGTPQTENNEQVLMTNPALLQLIILLGIVAVLVVFVGVWINRRKVDLR